MAKNKIIIVMFSWRRFSTCSYLAINVTNILVRRAHKPAAMETIKAQRRAKTLDLWTSQVILIRKCNNSKWFVKWWNIISQWAIRFICMIFISVQVRCYHHFKLNIRNEWRKKWLTLLAYFYPAFGPTSPILPLSVVNDAKQIKSVKR